MKKLPYMRGLLRGWDTIFIILSWICLITSFSIFAICLFSLLSKGGECLSLDFFLNYPSRFPEKAGIFAAWVGSLCVLVVTIFFTVPIGIAAGIYLEEYASRGFWLRLIEINIINLTAVPSIIYGLLALVFFVNGLGLGPSILSAGLTLSLLVLPIVITVTRQSIKVIPLHMREGAYALGATKWQVVKHHLLPHAIGNIVTGVIIGLARSLGEASPLITIGALSFVAYLPPSPIMTESPFLSFEWLFSSFTVLPIQIFNWISRPEESFQENAAAAAAVLVLMMFAMNIIAILIRVRFSRDLK